MEAAWAKLLELPCCVPGYRRGHAVNPNSRRLLDNFKLGGVIGQGAFGVVYLCEHRQTKQQFAVKMIDQVETPLPEIKREVEMLTKLAHGTVTKLVDTYFEKVFVCMVMQYYRGGDLMKGMSKHWASKGMIAMPVVRLLAAQMLAAICWLHDNNCVHRDVKGDNFMMDLPALEDPENSIYLADFGTVFFVVPGLRLKSKCGTKQYWSPEFYSLDYGLKVDCWAVGVVMFGLFTAKFPFKNEKDVRSKDPSIPKRVPRDGVDLMGHVLQRDEGRRYTAQKALQHPFIKDDELISPGNSPSDGSPSSAPITPEMLERGANAGVVQRRYELVNRLQRAHGTQVFPPKLNFATQARYTVEDSKTKRSLTYEWQDVEVAEEAASGHLRFDLMENPHETGIQATVLAKLLEDHNIPIDSFGLGDGKSFNSYLQELRGGKSMLLIDGTQYKSLVRTVPVTLLRIELATDSETFFLAEMMAPGKFQHVGTKTRPHETARQACERLKSSLGPLQDFEVGVDFARIARIEVESQSPSYPNMRTVYQKAVVPGKLHVTDPELLARLGVHTKDGPAFTVDGLQDFPLNFQWLTAHEALKHGLDVAPSADVSALVYPPVGLEEEELDQFLVDSGVQLEHWGKQTYKSLSEFSQELLKGEASLVKQPGGKLLREVEVVVMKISRASGEVLIEVGEEFQGERVERSRLPGLKKKAGEHHFWAGRRLITQFLNLPADKVVFDPHAVRTTEQVEESISYYGLTTLYRKIFLEGTLEM